MDKTHIKSFTELIAWQESHKLVLEIYKICKTFPSEERFGLASQIQRAAVSITSNIAEGFSRKSPKEKVNFYYIALGSLTEVLNQLIIAKDLSYINIVVFNKLSENTTNSQKLINGLIKSARTLKLHT